jgi:hypothetical protein
MKSNLTALIDKGIPVRGMTITRADLIVIFMAMYAVALDDEEVDEVTEDIMEDAWVKHGAQS